MVADGHPIKKHTEMITADTRLVDLTVGQLLALLEREPQEEKSSATEYVYGLDGVMMLFGIKSKNTASKYCKTILKDAVYRQGRTILLDKEKAMELFKRHEEENAGAEAQRSKA